jgi:hypothetical protein
MCAWTTWTPSCSGFTIDQIGGIVRMPKLTASRKSPSPR